MRRLLLTVVLVGIIYVLGTLVVNEIGTFIQSATLLLHGTTRNTITERVHAYVHESLNETLPPDTTIEIRTAHINNDSEEDIIARIESDTMCGTGGCMTLIILKDTEGDFTKIIFAYVVKEIDTENSLTNQMHDLRINDNTQNLMKWDGEQYTLNSY